MSEEVESLDTPDDNHRERWKAAMSLPRGQKRTAALLALSDESEADKPRRDALRADSERKVREGRAKQQEEQLRRPRDPVTSPAQFWRFREDPVDPADYVVGDSADEDWRRKELGLYPGKTWLDDI